MLWRHLHNPTFAVAGASRCAAKAGLSTEPAGIVRMGTLFERWVHDRSAGRRWMPWDGSECAFVRAATSFTQAYHVFFWLLANGLREASGKRSAQMRRDTPRTCCGCGSREVAWAWLSPGEGNVGRAWCRGCIPPHCWEHGLEGGGAHTYGAGSGMWWKPQGLA